MHELLQKLLEERARETGELRTFYNTAEERDGGWTGEDKQEWDRRNAGLDDLDARIKTVKDRADGDKQLDEYRAAAEAAIRPTVRDEGLPDEDQRAAAFFRGEGRSLDVSFAGLQTERIGNRRLVVGGVEQRTGLVEATASAGGATFNTSFRRILYQHLIFNSAIRQTNATVLTTSSGEGLLLPKTTAHPASGTIVAEAAKINENDPTFGQATLNAYKYANLVQVSSELEQDTAVDLLGYIAMAMGRALGNGSGADFVTGSGTSKPQGVLVGAGTVAQVVGGTPAASGATFANLVSLFDAIIPPYQVNAEWFMSQSALSHVRGLVNTQGTPIFLPSLAGGQPDTLFGKTVVIDPNMPAVATNGTSIAFGDFSSYFIRDVLGVRFERSVDFAFDHDLNSYRAILRTDGRLLDTTGAIATYVGGTS